MKLALPVVFVLKAPYVMPAPVAVATEPSAVKKMFAPVPSVTSLLSLPKTAAPATVPDWVKVVSAVEIAVGEDQVKIPARAEAASEQTVATTARPQIN